MKTALQIITFFLLCFVNTSCAQYVKIISATEETKIGGRAEAREEILTIKIKDNSKYEPSYIWVGGKKIPISKMKSGDTVTLIAVLWSEQDNFPTVGNPNPTDLKTNNSYAYLVLKNVKNKNELKQKIKITKVDKSHPIGNEVPYQ